MHASIPATALSFTLPDADSTDQFGEAVAELCDKGDVFLLNGPIGSGKTHFARAMIRSLLAREGRAEDIPSPTFTLVQVYDTVDFEIWHADLYRLGHPQEVIELGLDAAFTEALCLIEWPDRLGDLTPPTAIHLSWSQEGEGRRLTLSAPTKTLDRFAQHIVLKSLMSK